MKLFLLQLTTIFIVLLHGNPTDTKDQIIGQWENPDKTRQVEIFKKGEMYYGKILALKDTKNVKVKKGDIVMFDIRFANNKWIGKIKVPAKDNTFDMEITMPTIDKLNIKASFGLFNKTRIWTRIP
ncbi:MAG: DUF2147 domain-containing protein [Flavobacterium sp.]|nr:DUF2147 domain-containing protein [Flavobacterium sp.]